LLRFVCDKKIWKNENHCIFSRRIYLYYNTFIQKVVLRRFNRLNVGWKENRLLELGRGWIITIHTLESWCLFEIGTSTLEGHTEYPNTCNLFYTYICPLGQSLRILVPRYLNADRIPHHSVKIWVVGGRTVEEIPPQ